MDKQKRLRMIFLVAVGITIAFLIGYLIFVIWSNNTKTNNKEQRILNLRSDNQLPYYEFGDVYDDEGVDKCDYSRWTVQDRAESDALGFFHNHTNEAERHENTMFYQQAMTNHHRHQQGMCQ